MIPPSSKPPGTAGETQSIDIQDVELLLAEATRARSLPPPLPPEVRASHVPEQPMPPPSIAPVAPMAQQPSIGGAPSLAPEAPAGRSPAFYVVALVAFLVVGVGGGLLVAMKLRKPLAPTVVVVPSGNPQAAVITIPTVEVDDDPDAGAAK